MAFVLVSEIQHLATRFGVERLGFFTLTFADHVVSIKEAQKRFHSLRTHVLEARYRCVIGCWERQKSRRVHFHLVVVLDAPIRHGVDFEAFERKDYRTAGKVLRSEWKFWRETAPKYRFGRTELLPVKSTGEGIARYVGKYVSKHIGQRVIEDKGARCVRFIGFKPGERIACTRFGWNSDRAWLWRQKVAAFARRRGCSNSDELKFLLGPRWAYNWQETILSMDLGDVVYPSRECADSEAERRHLSALNSDSARPARPKGSKFPGHTSPTPGGTPKLHHTLEATPSRAVRVYQLNPHLMFVPRTIGAPRKETLAKGVGVESAGMRMRNLRQDAAQNKPLTVGKVCV